jgi:light-regulated signal transduction histidine kinase (bacteriophytochrome)
MNNLIEDVLEFSKISTVEMRQEQVDLDKILQSVLYNIDGFLQDKNGKVEYGEMPIITGNSGYLHQLFQNLIVNGVKYNEKTQPKVYIDCQLKDATYQFMIKDNGIGIDEEYRELIFEMFKRLHTSDKYEGTGIGLALCKKIVEQHGGRIWVGSSDENGSRFYCTLPSYIAETTTIK